MCKCVYLPSTDIIQTVSFTHSYMNDLASLIGALETSGPIIILEDLNAYLDDRSSCNTCRNLLLDTICSCYLFDVLSSSISSGPGYTYFSGGNRTTVNYILANKSISHLITNCYMHIHHGSTSLTTYHGQLAENTTIEN